MSVGRNLKVGTALSLTGGALTLLNSVEVMFSSQYPTIHHTFAASLMIAGGILVLVAAICMYTDLQHRMFWGAVVLFSSILGLLAVGIVGYRSLIPIGTFALIMGVVGGALGIAQK